MKLLQLFGNNFIKKRRRAIDSSALRTNRLKHRILPKRYVEEDDASLFI